MGTAADVNKNKNVVVLSVFTILGSFKKDLYSGNRDHQPSALKLQENKIV